MIRTGVLWPVWAVQLGMNIPDEVVEAAYADFHATLGSGSTEPDFTHGFRVGAEWAHQASPAAVFDAAWDKGYRLLEPEGGGYPPAAFWYRGRMYRYVLEDGSK